MGNLLNQEPVLRDHTSHWLWCLRQRIGLDQSKEIDEEEHSSFMETFTLSRPNVLVVIVMAALIIPIRYCVLAFKSNFPASFTKFYDFKEIP